jgi:hypothetical protein
VVGLAICVGAVRDRGHGVDSWRRYVKQSSSESEKEKQA